MGHFKPQRQWRGWEPANCRWGGPERLFQPAQEATAMNPITPFYKDKALYVTILGVLLQPLSAKLGIALDPAQVYGLFAALIAYVIAHKWKSAVLTLAQVGAAGVNAAAPKP